MWDVVQIKTYTDNSFCKQFYCVISWVQFLLNTAREVLLSHLRSAALQAGLQDIWLDGLLDK
jgi:hypothetical protein